MRISDWSSDVCSSDLLIPYPFETEQHDAHVADARACSQRIMNAKRQHLPPQALAGTRRQGRNTSGAPKMEKASQRDHPRPVLLHSCEAAHKRDRSVPKGTGEYIKADRSCKPPTPDMLAFTPTHHEPLPPPRGQTP